MYTILKGPIPQNTTPNVIPVLLEDPDLSEAVAECSWPKARSAPVQDFAEIAVRCSERHQTDQNVQSAMDALEQARLRYEQQRRDDLARWEQQRKVERQIREQQSRLERQKYESQLAEQRRQFETQIENQKAFFERRAETARKIQAKERAAHRQELQKLNDTVGALSTLLGEVRCQLSHEEQTGSSAQCQKALHACTKPVTKR